MYVSYLSAALLLMVSAVGIEGSPRSKRVLPTNKNCDPRNEVCAKGDWIDTDVADCQRTSFFKTCKAQNSVFYSWIVDVAKNDGCEPVVSTGGWWKKKKKPIVCGSAGTNTRCVCSDYKILPNECRCQYWPDHNPDSTDPAFCTGYYTGGSSRLHHWACCNNCNDHLDNDDALNETESSCDGLTWHGGSSTSYCGSCGESTGGGRPKYYFNCGSCSVQRECEEVCSGPIQSLPGFCWKWLDCFKGCCQARDEQSSEDNSQNAETMSFCGDGTCESKETRETCPTDCCYKVNQDCATSNPRLFEDEFECCGDSTCCL